MKKLLSVLATFGIVASSTVSVVACGAKSETKPEKPEEPKEDLNDIIRDFQEEVTNIYIDHMKIEVIQNLIVLSETEKNYLFIKKDNIKAFSNREKEITFENKKQIENDENLILKSKLLAEKLNELKKVNKYKVILDEVDSLFDGVEIIFNDNFKIKSGELFQGVYIWNFINEYKINIKYKGKSDIEKFELKDTLKYTSTDSEIFKVAGDNLVKNIENDFLVSNEMKKYSNF
ncbi:lipoprotein [Spiroplasma endosymbiont of Atherix ibis]|uniref:lipoprotein n=1 Tax=Spiroplasma endosymbiont of Atherix ibis TaxID=3066291 RepID=UPI0030CD9BAA